MLFPRCPFLAIRATRIPQRLIYAERAEPSQGGEPVKKASYERSKNAWRTCDLPMPQGTTRTQLASPSFLLPLSPSLSPSSPNLPLRFPSFLFRRASVSFVTRGLGPLPPFCGLRIKAAPDLRVGRTLQMDVTPCAFPVRVASRAVASATFAKNKLPREREDAERCSV